jgi:hypothetical protein
MDETYRMLGREHELDLEREARTRGLASRARPRIERGRHTMKRSTVLALLAASAAVALAMTAFAFASTDGSSRPAAVSAPTAVSAKLASQLAQARLATAKYATNLGRAKADGYGIITRMIPSMGWHFMNPTVTGFDVRKPAILVYVRRGAAWQLGALEWVFPEIPAKPPIQGARYGVFGAACHYADGTFVPADAESKCAATSPDTGAKFNFWHPPLVTLHIWLWYPNPSGLYSGTNPLVTPFDKS